MPINDNGFPNKYPNVIDDALFKNKSKLVVNKNQLHIDYDFRAKSYEQENTFIIALENAFEDLNRTITMYNTFRNILPKIIDEHERLKLKYKKKDDENCIETTIKNIRMCNITYEIIDFI